MQLFLTIDYNTPRVKFETTVMEYIKSFEGTQIVDEMTNGTGWTVYKILIPIESKDEALEIRKEVERLCKLTKRKPACVRFRQKDASASNVNIFGLTPSEQVEFNEKAPRGVWRCIQV